MIRVPKVVPLASATMKGLPLGPAEGFLLSRIDGTVSEQELAALTGLPIDQVTQTLEKLASLGVITFPEPAVATKPRPEPRPSNLPPHAITEVLETTRSGARVAPRGLYDPSELDEDVEIEIDHRRAILDRYHQLAELDHYQLLGVARGSDKKAVKKAYFEAAALFHPDRHFRKRLGSFKQKMEALFSRITLAHDTLVDAEKRAEYDAYLGDVDSTRALEQQLEEPVPPRAAPTPVPASAPPATPPARPSAPIVSEQARRDALARRLMGGARASTVPPIASPSAPDPGALRRHYDDRMSAVRDRLARDHLTTAREAARKGDWIAATTAYKLALNVAPNDPEIQTEAREAQERAATILATQYRKQGLYEEKNRDWVAAARSWIRLAKMTPDDWEAHERAAHAIVRAEGNLHEAAEHGKRAIALNPQSAKCHATLAEVYLAAGLVLNAKREAEAAGQLAPEDVGVQQLLRKVAKLK